jgi:hypothetical protein
LKISISNFKGTKPKLAAHLLGGDQAQTAQNTRLEKSDLRAWRKPFSTLQIAAGSNYKALYQYKTDDVGIGNQWVSDQNDLDFAESPIANDTHERLYYSGAALPRFFANDMDSDPWDKSVDNVYMGPVPPVDTGTWGFVSGHTGGSSYRAYVYTYVTRYGVETGPIATILETTTYNTGNVVIEDFTQPPADYGMRTTVGSNIPYVRVYRTNSSQTGAEFQYVGQFNASTHTFGTDTFTDNIADADLGEVLITEGHTGVSDEIQGLIGLSNGIFAAFFGNELHLSEPYLPDSWKASNIKSFDYNIVGLGYLGTNIIVLTEGIPYIVTGAAPESMTKTRLNGFYPCVSKRSIVSSLYGVIYASHEGLILIDHNGPRNITLDFITPNEWGNYSPSYIHGQFYNGKYFGCFNDIPNSNTGSFVFDVQNETLSSLGKYYQATYLEVADGKMYIINYGEETTNIMEWAGDPYNFLYYTWKSKKFVLPQDTGYTCAQVLVDKEEYSNILAAIGDNAYLEGENAALFAAAEIGGNFNYGDFSTYDEYWNSLAWNESNLTEIADLSVDQYINFKLYVDNTLVMTKTISTDTVFRLVPHRGRRIEVELSGYIPIRRVVLAQSPKEIG